MDTLEDNRDYYTNLMPGSPRSKTDAEGGDDGRTETKNQNVRGDPSATVASVSTIREGLASVNRNPTFLSTVKDDSETTEDLTDVDERKTVAPSAAAESPTRPLDRDDVCRSRSSLSVVGQTPTCSAGDSLLTHLGKEIKEEVVG